MKKAIAKWLPGIFSLCFAGVGLFFICTGPVSLISVAAAIGTAITSPTTAMNAAVQLLDETIHVIQIAQTFDENDYSSGFWTELPEQVPNPPATPPTEQPAGFLPIVETAYTQGKGERFLKSGAGWVRNVTELSAKTVQEAMMQPLPFKIEFGTDAPQVLIMHTHATETYQLNEDPFYDPAFTCRTTDTTYNMVRVGAEIAAKLNAAGISTVQDATLHDYPSYNGSYAASKKTVEKYLAQHPSIKVVLDVHRDAIEKDDGTRIKPVFTAADGQKGAQIMIIAGADNGKLNMPNYMQNLRFASRLQDSLERAAPGMTRPVLFDYRNYNQQLTTGSLLIEMGGHANCLEEVLLSARNVGDGLVQLFREAQKE